MATNVYEIEHREAPWYRGLTSTIYISIMPDSSPICAGAAPCAGTAKAPLPAANSVAGHHGEDNSIPQIQCTAPVQYRQYIRNTGSFHLGTAETLRHSKRSKFVDILPNVSPGLRTLNTASSISTRPRPQRTTYGQLYEMVSYY